MVVVVVVVEPKLLGKISECRPGAATLNPQVITTTKKREEEGASWREGEGWQHSSQCSMEHAEELQGDEMEEGEGHLEEGEEGHLEEGGEAVGSLYFWPFSLLWCCRPKKWWKEGEVVEIAFW
jgi:hypothetical protein